MARILFALFVAVPIIEIALFILLGETIGLLPTLLGILVTAVIGSFVIRVQGLSLLMKIQSLTNAGQFPAKEVAEGVMLAIAGVLLLTPGYFTDFFGFLLLVPTIRTAVYHHLKSRVDVQGFATSTTSSGFSTKGPHNLDDPDVVDLDEEQWRDK